MSKKVFLRSESVYNFILHFYPKKYRQEFGEEMKYVFSESIKDANSGNGEGLVSFWVRTIIDSGKSIVKENLEARKSIHPKGGEKMKNKNIIRPLFAAMLILSVPFFAMIIGVYGWDWGSFDFILMGTLIFGTGLVVEIVNMKIKNKNHKIIVIALIIFALLAAWVHLAVGIVDTWPLAGS